MMAGDHRIRRLVLEVTTPSRDVAIEAQNRLRGLAGRLVGVLSGVGSVPGSDLVHRVERVEIDLGSVDLSELEDLLIDRLRERLGAGGPTLGERGAGSAERMTGTARRLDRLRHFLVHGDLPWHARPADFRDLDRLVGELVAADPGAMGRVLEAVVVHGAARRRLVANLSDETLRRLLAAARPWASPTLDEIERVLKAVHERIREGAGGTGRLPPLRLFVFDALLAMVGPAGVRSGREPYAIVLATALDGAGLDRNRLERAFERPSAQAPGGSAGDTDPVAGAGPAAIVDGLPEPARRALEEILEARRSGLPAGGPRDPGSVESPGRGGSEAGGGSDIEADRSGKEPIPSGPAARDTWYVENAGLVLLWPYLPRYLEILGLVEDGAFPDRSARRAAACEMEYLVRGEEEFREFDLVLNRLLCGFEQGEAMEWHRWEGPIDSREAATLLHRAVEHWEALGSTSVAGFRRAFLRRDGKLTRQGESDWHLVVDRKGHDVLLARLPHPISVVSLPWTTPRLHVEW